MAQKPRVGNTLAEDPCSIPNTHVGKLFTACSSSFRGCESLASASQLQRLQVCTTTLVYSSFLY